MVTEKQAEAMFCWLLSSILLFVRLKTQMNAIKFVFVCFGGFWDQSFSMIQFDLRRPGQISQKAGSDQGY